MTTPRNPSYDLARPVECYRGPSRYDAEVLVQWLKKQWVVKTRCASREEATAAAQAVVEHLHTRIEALVLEEMAKFKEAQP